MTQNPWQIDSCRTLSLPLSLTWSLAFIGSSFAARFAGGLICRRYNLVGDRNANLYSRLNTSAWNHVCIHALLRGDSRILCYNHL
jgi:hypothetical protein